MTTALGGEVLALGGLADDPADGARRIAEALRSGRAAERFAAMVRAQGGPADLLSRPDHHLPRAPVCRDVFAEAHGVLAAVDARLVGIAVVGLGGGRSRAGETVDPSVGFTGLAPLGATVGPGARPLGTVLARTEAAAEVAAALLRRACRVGDAPPPMREPVIERVVADEFAS